MARVTHVKSAQVRYVRDENGKRTDVVKPNRVCDKCAKEIVPGSSYKHMSIKTGPRSSRTLVRCGSCPTWHRWEYSNSLDARVEQIVHQAQEAIDIAENSDEIESALVDAAESAREISEEKEESAQNVEDGFGHETETSATLRETAEALESWATELESVSIDDAPETCEECNGQGRVEPGADEDYDEDDLDSAGLVECGECNGTGEATEDQLQAWREEVEVPEYSG